MTMRRKRGEADRRHGLGMAHLTHELRSPLTAIIGFAELLNEEQAGPLCQRQKEFLDHILAGAHHLLRVVNDTLDLAKVDAGKMDFTPSLCDVGEIMRELGSLTRLQTARKELHVHINVDPALGLVMTDPLRLRQVLLNYLSNAIKFTPENGTITMRARVEGARTFRIEVADDGPGISASEIGKLFVDFQQLDSSSRCQGAGLGLALTKRMVEAQGGQVGVASRVGEGSVFYAVLPSCALRLAEPPCDGAPSAERTVRR
jgi:signal transduction histidine kinase